MGNYETKINKAFNKGDKPSRYATLRKLAMDKGLGVDRIVFSNNKSTYFFYDMKDFAVDKAEGKTYSEVIGRTQGFNEALAFVAAYESKEKENTKTVSVDISGISPFRIKEITGLPRGFGLSGLPGFESYEVKGN